MSSAASPVAQYSSKADAPDGARTRANSGSGHGAGGLQRRPACDVGNTAVVVLMVCLLAVAAALVSLNVQEADRHRQEREEADFRAAAASHIVAMQELLTATVDKTVQYGAFVQQIRTLESFAVYSSHDDERGKAKLWIPYVRHSERAAFEAAASAMYQPFFNDTSYTVNITNYERDSMGNLIGFTVAEARSEYFPTLLLAGSTLPTARNYPGRDMLTEPSRALAILKAQRTRAMSSTNRIFALNGDLVVATTALVLPVYDAGNDTKLLGMMMIGARPEHIAQEAVNELAPAALRVRIYDITGDEVDQAGCLRPLLYDGTRSRLSGSWTVKSIEPTAATCPDDPWTEVEDSSITNTVSFADRTWLFVLDKGPDAKTSDTTLSTEIMVASGVLVAVAVVLVTGVLVRAWWLMADLRQAQLKEQHASRQSREFLSFVTHELRNPLFALLGTAGELSLLVNDHPSAPAAFGEIASSIEVCSERMTSIINDVLNVRKLEAGKLDLDLGSVSLESVSREVFAMFSQRTKAAGQQFSVHVRRQVPKRVTADAGRLVQVLSNFLSNAIKFTPHGGLVRVMIDRTDPPEWWLAQQRSKQASGSRHSSTADIVPIDDTVWLCFNVEDSGSGIAPEVMSRLFQPYEQGSARVASQHGGTGLGLSICKMLVECMGGEVRVESQLGSGSTFSMLLPLVPVDPEAGDSVALEIDAPAPNDAEVLKASPRPLAVMPQRPSSTRSHTRSGSDRSGSFVLQSHKQQGSLTAGPTVADMSMALADPAHQPLAEAQGKSVLVVDDMSINRRVLGNLFSRFLPGVIVDMATDGEQAVRKVEAMPSGNPYVMVLMDVIMPRMDGRQAVRQMRERGFTLPVFALTGSDSLEEQHLNSTAGYTETVAKPVRSAVLVGLMSKCLRSRGADADLEILAPISDTRPFLFAPSSSAEARSASSDPPEPAV